MCQARGEEVPRAMSTDRGQPHAHRASEPTWGLRTSFPTQFIDESFRGQTKATILGQDLSWVCLAPSPFALCLPGATFQ